MGSREQGHGHQQPGPLRGTLHAVLLQLPQGTHHPRPAGEGHQRESEKEG